MSEIINARVEPGGRRVRYEVVTSGGTLGPYLAPYTGGEAEAVAAAHFASLPPQTYRPPAIDPDLAARAARERLVNEASALLTATDYVEFRAPRPERTPTAAWLAWREALRDVIRGTADTIPEEPARYA